MEQPKKILVKKFSEPDVNQVSQDSVKKKIMVKALTPQEKRLEVQKEAQFKRDEIVRKKDSIINRNLASTGLTREQYKSKQISDSKKPDACLPGLNIGSANKRGETKGSCSTGQSNKGESLKDNK